ERAALTLTTTRCASPGSWRRPTAPSPLQASTSAPSAPTAAWSESPASSGTSRKGRRREYQAQMPIPTGVARFNKRVTNRVASHIAGWMPGFAIVSHVGRRSGLRYRTPVNVFQDRERFVFALTYGADADWVRNVVAAGSCEIRTRRSSIALRDPEVFTDPTRRKVPIPVRWILGLIHVDEFMALERDETRGTGTRSPVGQVLHGDVVLESAEEPA